MQDWPLLCHRIIDHAAANHAERRVVSRSSKADPYDDLRFHRRGRSRSPSGSIATASGAASASRRGCLDTWRHLEACMASSASAASINPSIRGSFPIRSPGINHAEDRE